MNFFYENDLSSLIQFVNDNNNFCRVLERENANFVIYNEVLQNLGKNGNQQLKSISKSLVGNSKAIIFIIDDYEKRYTHFPNLILLRTSVRKSIIRTNEIALPYLWDNASTNFKISSTSIMPLVGFCGFISKHRKKIVAVFENSKNVQCNFIIQKDFWGGKPHDIDLVKLFNDNLNTNQYILCNRGKGNFSMRFYQTLACGRVPVLVDTDIELPFKNIINWDQIIILEKTEKACLQAVLDDHKKNGFIERQRKAIFIFNEYFSKENYFNQLIAHHLTAL